ncbi:MAG: DNA repair protein RadA, partial [Deferribacteraceae bacterium]|nr:DNA repair protein RadA [Deferribacteraceae bacterium]
MAKAKTRYVCSNCGSFSAKWQGKCSDCGAWNSFVEEVVEAKSTSFGGSGIAHYQPTASPISMSDVKGVETIRFHTGIDELDLVLGGGLVKGSVV